MKQSNSKEFILAMKKEIDNHHDRGHWHIEKRSSLGNIKTILAIWSFKRNQFPDGTINKHKVRLCAHGGMQVWGVKFWETFLPVVNWMSVCFF